MPSLETATFAGGCFWCLEAVFEPLKGVHDVVSGYTGGGDADPDYRKVCSGGTGHAEAIQITFDPGVIRYADLLQVFFAFHDPTTRDRQGPDVGSQYRSAIFFSSPDQEQQAHEAVAGLTHDQVFSSPIVTEIVPLVQFHTAEASHQDYFRRNPEQAYCQAMIAPKIAKLRQRMAERLA